MGKKNRDNRDGAIGNSELTIAQPKQGLQRVHWIFTFNNYLLDDIPLLEIYLKEICVSYAFQREIGEKCGTPHLQGVITLKKRARITELLYPKVHWGGKNPEIPVKNVGKAYEYATKKKTREEGTVPFTYNYDVPEELDLITPDMFFDWQKDIIKMIETKADKRLIYWYHEPVGGIGKTEFAKYICVNYNAICVSGKSENCKFAIVAYHKIKHVYPSIIIYNVPRSNHDYISYEGMESIKDGFFFSGKYESCQVIFNRPHVLVFANDEPEYNKMSTDKWNVVRLLDSSADDAENEIIL